MSICRRVRNLDLKQRGPIQLILKNCFYPHVLERYERVCSKLIEIFKEEYNLMDHLALIRV